MAKPSIRTVLLHYGSDELRETSSWRSVRCPFHEDSNASARYISDGEDNEAFHCNVGCVSGDAYVLVQQFEGVDFVGALEFLERLTGEQLSSGGPAKPARYRPVRLGEEAPAAPAAPTAKKKGRRQRRLID
jgi:DNA primase